MALATFLASNAGSLIGAAGSIGAGFLGSHASATSAARQYWYQRALQEQAAELNYNYSLKSAENMPTSTRKGLVSAGYNPMLAVQNSTGGANASFTSAGTAGTYNEADAISSGIANATNYANLINQEKQTNSTVATNEAVADANYANADKAKAEKATLMERMPWISKREKAEIGNIEKDSLKKEAEIHNIDETTRFIEKDFELRQKLGMMGIDVQRYGINKNYASSIYNSDTLERNNQRTNRVNTSLEHIRHPYASFAHKSYTAGKDYKGSYSDPWK